MPALLGDQATDLSTCLEMFLLRKETQINDKTTLFWFLSLFVNTLVLQLFHKKKLSSYYICELLTS